MARGDFALVTHPERQPACCFITRSTQGPFIDTGIDVQLRSQPGNPLVIERVYLAVSTIANLAQFAGVTSTEQHSSDRERQLIAIGKLEGFKEGLGDAIVDVARTLGRWLDDAGVGSARGGGDSAL